MSNAEVTVIGNLTADPEMKYTGNGAARLAFSIASNRRYQSDGEWKEETSYFNCVAWRNTAETAANVLEKGIPVIVKGRLEQRSWEADDGTKRSTVEIVVDTVGINTWGIESVTRRRGNGGGNANSTDSGSYQRNEPQRPQRNVDPFEDF